ncbi:ANTAR domain-containing protein [Pseudonocardia nantongensis]|uniref:ANTAR domain-containing protein n=1 Tax=Pseudonocardia nantongensis TaxID=1181885 RepID=UPI00397A82C6
MAELQRRIEGLTQALRTRDVIGQAKGVLVSHYGISDEDAFALLVRLSQHTNTKLHTIATALLARIRRDGPAPAEHCQRVTTCLARLAEDARRAPAGAPPDPEG